MLQGAHREVIVDHAAVTRGEQERDLRRQLGIPDKARAVLVFGETSHWDPNWLHTTEEYYDQRIRVVLDRVLEELAREPRRVFSIESLFFIQRYWQRNPRRRRALGELLDARRLRLTGTGITTPDTVLPDTEAILRDYLHGQQWLREQGIGVEPRLAYLPDDFGHSPALPAMLRALGLDLAGITRIDGMYFVGSDYRRKRDFPLPGSSAELLARELRTLDFIWRAPDGSEVLCHWNAFTYFQGDMLGHAGIIRWMGMTFGVPWRTRGHVSRRVRGYVTQLGPLARTPYMFCPIGCDFNDPTFWPARSFVHVGGEEGGWGLALFLGGPAAVSFTEQGVVEWIALRNAPKERAYGVLPVLAHPAAGTDPGEGAFDYAVWITPRGDYRANQLPQHVRGALRGALKAPRAADLEARAGEVVVVDHPDVLVAALKRAARGRGVIARLHALAGWEAAAEVRLACPARPIREALLCDGLERDLAALVVEAGIARVPIRGAISSVRLLF